MKHTFKIPYLEKEVDWYMRDDTYVIGYNGSGKTLLLKEMMKWCDDHGYDYIHYDAIYALDEFEYYLEGNDDDIALATKMMCEVYLDFEDDLSAWLKSMLHEVNDVELKAYDDFISKIDCIKKIIGMSGNGYKRIFVILMKALEKPHGNFYFLDLPETSLHIMIAREITRFLMHNFDHMKFVIATHSPEVVRFNTDDDEYIINLCDCHEEDIA